MQQHMMHVVKMLHFVVLTCQRSKYIAVEISCGRGGATIHTHMAVPRMAISYLQYNSCTAMMINDIAQDDITDPVLSEL
jgi:hypothetical protein